MKMNPYLYFAGNCEEAFKFYERCLGGKIQAMMTHAGTPAEGTVPPEWKNKIIHAALSIGDQTLMASDAPPAHFSKPQGFSVSLHIEDAAEAERVFNALAEKGTINMPFEQTFWAKRFGMLVDQFGTPWMINCPPSA